MKISRNIILAAIFMLAIVTQVFAATEVTSISAAPNPFNPLKGENASISVYATPGVTGIEVRVLMPNQTTLVRSGLALFETSSGLYTASWDGKDNSGQNVTGGDYVIRVFNPATTTFMGPWGSISLEGIRIQGITGGIFSPTGTNKATITVQTTPGQAGLKIGFMNSYQYVYDSNSQSQFPLTETTPGVYTFTWDATGFVCYYNCTPIGILPDGIYTIKVYDGAGSQLPTTGTITVAAVSAVSTSPTTFNAIAGENTIISAAGVEGLNLQAQIQKDSNIIRTIDMTGSGTSYTCTWDGKDGSGVVVPVGSYSIIVKNAGSGVRYVPSSSVTISIGDATITATPSIFNPTGTNKATITVQTTPGQAGLKIGFMNSYQYVYDSNSQSQFPLTETTPGVYTFTWDATGFVCYYNCTPIGILPDGIYTIKVYDGAGSQLPTTGTITVAAVSAVSASPNPFTPGGSNLVTISVNGASEVNLEARVYNNSTNALTRDLPLIGSAGTFTVDWDGKDSYGNFAGANIYRVQIFNRDSGMRYSPETTLNLNVAVFSISASPDPFLPTGGNSVTITVRADALQSGLYAMVSHPQNGSSSALQLHEEGSAGTYVTTWDGKINGVLPQDGICTIRVFDNAGNQYPATGTFAITSVKSFFASPSPFEVTGSSTTTITAQMPAGLHLEVRIGTVRTLNLTDWSGTYTATWDGKDNNGYIVPALTYTVSLWNSDTGTRYDMQASIPVKIVDSVPPDTSIVSGPAEGTYVNPANITFTWTGTDNLTGPLTYAYQLDTGAWSAFDSATSYTFTTLADGPHTFSVKAKDQAGNEDLSPAVRHFTVDGTPPQPAVNLTATPTQTGIRLDWTHSLSADVDSYKLFWDNGTGTINYAAAFATIYYPAKTFTASFYTEGTYKYALRAVDRAGNEEQNTSLVASATISGFTVSVDAEASVHKRGDDVPITGSVLSSDLTPLFNVPVTIEIESKGYVRTYSAFTKANGGFSYLFQPLSTEAGSYTVKVRVLYQGLEKSATASFSILGMLMEPAQVTIDMSMNSPKTVNINLRNIGSTTMSELQYTLVDSDLSDPVNGFIDTASLPTSLAAGASATIPVLVTADPGTPSVPAVLTLNVASSDGTTESAKITARLHDAVSLPVVNPDPIMVGVRTGEPVTKTVTITNQGYATMQDSTLTVHDPAVYGWVTIPNGTFGTFSPQEAKNCQIVVNPPEGTTLGTYVVQLDLKYDNGTTKPVYMTVEVTTATVGQMAFKVHDDTGSVVSGAEVNLISKAFYVNVTPNGRQEYNNVLKGTTNQQGYILFNDVPAGDYRYVVNAARHDQKDGLITVEPGSTPQTIGVILVTNLVNVDFSVTQTTIQDQYSVNLNITYVTDLIKPTLYATPYRVDLSFFPEETFQGALTIKNTSNNAPVRNLTLDSSALDGTENELKVVFDDGTNSGTQKITLGELGPGQSIQIPYKAIIYASNPKLNNRNLGNIIASAEFDFSIDGKVEKSTTTTPIPFLYWKPQEFSLPGISYLNDETGGQSCNLQYQGTTYRMSVKSNRNVGVTLDSLKAVNQVNGGPDATSIISSNSSMWTGSFSPKSLSTKGEISTFDIDDLKSSLEAKCNSDRSNFLGKPNYIGFIGTWSDRSPNKDAYLIPISIITKSDVGMYIVDTTPGGGGWIGGTIPTFNEHGTVKMQIEQKVSLEREAFNAKLNIKPSVTPLNNFMAKVSIKDENGDDASGQFFVVVTQKTGIASVDGSTVSSPVDITWQLIPNSNAGGTSADGKNYSLSATIDYSYSGGSYTFTTLPETITVKPMPKLTIDYKLPYITMAGKSVKIKAIVTNNGYGPAHNLVIKSAQPKIIENLSNVPVSFTLLGSSATPYDSTLNSSSLDINFGDIPAGGTAEGYWLLSTTNDGYFVEFTSTLTHQDYMGIQLDPLIEATNTHLIPAIGGEIFMPPNTTEGMKVELYQGGELKGQDIVNAYGNYLIPDLTGGVYQWALKDSNGNSVGGTSRDVTVMAAQPTARIDYGQQIIVEYEKLLPKSPSSKKLILITHGFNSNADAWANTMVSNICSRMNVSTENIHNNGKISWCETPDGWEVKSFDWRESAAPTVTMKCSISFIGIGLPGLPSIMCKPEMGGPENAYPKAISLGRDLGNDISMSGYEVVHMIGHSTGAAIIDAASIAIKNSIPTTKVHLTFLDAYHPNGPASEYGIKSDWAEHYVDTRFVLDDIWSNNIILTHAYNFDITNLLNTENVGDIIFHTKSTLEKRHAWPYYYYDKTIYGSIMSIAKTVGYALSNESAVINANNSDLASLNWGTFEDYVGPISDDLLYPKGGKCELYDLNYQACGCNKNNFASNKCEKQELNYSIETTNISSLYKYSASLSGTNILNNDSISLTTGSPSWVNYVVEISNKANFVQFVYEATGSTNRVLSAYLDGEIIYNNIRALNNIGNITTDKIAFSDVEPGKHIITFRLESLDGIRADVKISNLKFGRITSITNTPIVDSSAPTSLIISPLSAGIYVDSQLTIYGTADDGTGSGVKTVEVSLNGGTNWVTTEGTTDWQYQWNVPATGTYTAISRATDNVGNVEVSSAGISFTVSLPDLVAPTGSIKIQAADNYTKSTAVTLTLAANDTSGISHMCISNTDTCTDWQLFVQSLPWQLTTGDGLKTVRAWFRDGVGNSNIQPCSATVTLDMTAPTLTISTLKNGASTNNVTLNVPGSVTDNYGIKTLTINDNFIEIDSNNSFSYALPLTVGLNTVNVIATDLAGNPTVDTRIITYDPNVPILTISGPMDNSRTNISFIDVTGTIDENSTVAVKVNASPSEFAEITDNTFKYTANLTTGTNTIEVTATDIAENTSHAKRTIVYDDLKPSLSIVFPEQDITTSLNSILLKGTVSDALTAVTVKITVDNQTFTPQLVNGAFEQTITFTTAKSYSITVTATDEATNSTSVQRNIIYAPQRWNDVTSQTSITKSTTIYDRLNNTYYANISVRNSAATPLSGPVRMVIVNPSIPLITTLPVGLKPDGYTAAGEPYFNIVPQTGTLAAGATISNLRVNFEVQRVPLTYGVRVEQYK